MTRPRILVIDDQFALSPDLRDELCDLLQAVEVDLDTSQEAFDLATRDATAGLVFCSGQLADGDTRTNSLRLVEDTVASGWPSTDGWRWALLLLDVRFDSRPVQAHDATFGLQLLEHLVQRWPDLDAAPGNSALPLVMLSSVSRLARSEDANRAGASAYVEKSNLDRPRLLQLLDDHGLIEDFDPMGRHSSSLIQGRSLALLRTLRESRRVARLEGRGNAMILGPQGCGKTLLASYIHACSRRPGRLMHYFASPTAEQMEYASLFGCWEGVYTGQRKESYPGVAEQAHRGTLLIDEVHNLKPTNQAELLEFGRLDQRQRRWITRLGKTLPTQPRSALLQARRSVLGKLEPESAKIAVDLLLLTASSEPIHDPDWRRRQLFNDPLYTRLAQEYAGRPVHVPGLQERSEDIPLLFQRFLERKADESRQPRPAGIAPDVFSALVGYAWPGNIAELQGVAHYVIHAAKGFDVVRARHLPPHLAHSRRKLQYSPPPPPPQPHPPSSPDPAVTRHHTRLPPIEELLVQAPVGRSAGELEGRLNTLQEAYGILVQRHLVAALDATRNRTGAPRNATLGDLVPTRAVKLLLGKKKMTSTQAAGALLRLGKLFPNPPEPDSDLDRALTWARSRRR